MVGFVWCQETLGSYDEYYPNHSRGYVKNAFDINGFDNVNLYSGNLTIDLPLGPALHPTGDVTLQIALHYNSSIWADEDRKSGYYPNQGPKAFGQGALLGTRFAGLGWSLHFGRIAQKDMYFPGVTGGQVSFISPDGADHQLFSSRFGPYHPAGSPGVCDDYQVGCVYYSRDGSDLKAERIGTGWKVFFPSGMVGFYEEQLDQYEHFGFTTDVPGRDFARLRDGWYCTKLEDQWGNHIDITYEDHDFKEAFAWGDGGGMNGDPYGNEMTQLIPVMVEEYRADGTRLRYVTFELEYPSPIVEGGQVRPARITAIRFHEPGGGVFLQYNLDYALYDYAPQLQLQSYAHFDCWNVDIDPDCDPVVGLPDDAKWTDWVYFLDKVSVEGSDVAYSFYYWTCGEVAGSEVVPACPDGTPDDDKFSFEEVGYGRWEGQQRGVIREIDLPTGGTIHYAYDIWSFQHHSMNVFDPYDGHHCVIEFPSGNLVNTPPPWDPPPGYCIPTMSYGLGIATREVSDNGVATTRTHYENHSASTLALPVRFDSGNPAVPFPEVDNRDEQEDPSLQPFWTSFSTTTVTTDFVVDADGVASTDIGTRVRSDESVYHFSLGTSVIDRNGDNLMDSTEPRTLPLTGALIYEQHFRGPADTGTLKRTVAHTYGLDDDASSWPSNPLYGSQVNRRPRETITYYHGAGPLDHDLVSITKFKYEADTCTSVVDEPCENLESGVGFENGFASHRTDVQSQTEFQEWVAGFSLTTMFDPLDTMSFDRHVETIYWKDALTDVTPEWLLNRPKKELVSINGAPKLETSSDYGLDRGELASSTMHADPGGSANSEDIVSRYVYVETNTDSGYGQVGRRLVGFAGKMGGSDPNAMAPDLSEFIEYEEATPAKTWLLCQKTFEPQTAAPYRQCVIPDVCSTWPLLAAVGKPAELQSELTIDPGWRLPASIFDANGDGIASITYDRIGRVKTVTPTSSDMSKTWLTYDEMKQTAVKVENSSGYAQVVARYDYDGVGRISHAARRRIGTTGTGYVESNFHHKTFRYDGLGTTWRQSNWRATPDTETGDSDANVVKTVDPFGRPEKTRASDGSVTTATYWGTRRNDLRVYDPGATTPGSRKVTDSDARGNVTRVLEDKDTATLGESLTNPSSEDFVISSFAYDSGDRLTATAVKGRDSDNTERTQNRSFSYDPRGFLIEESYPELGPGSVQYCKHDATGQPRRMAYGAFASQCNYSYLTKDIIDTYTDAAGRHVETWVKRENSADGEAHPELKWYFTAETEYGLSATASTIGKPVRADQYTSVTTPNAIPVNCVDPEAVRVRELYTYRGPQGLVDHRTTEVAFGHDGLLGAESFDAGFGYDRWGNVDLIEYPRLDPVNYCQPTNNLRYTHGAMGLLGLSEEEHPGGTQVTDLLFSPNFSSENGMMTSWRSPSGLGADSEIYHAVEPDGTRLRVKRMRAHPVYSWGGLAAPVFDTGNYAYDGAGNVKSIAGSAGVALGWSYAYDALSRITQADPSSAAARSFVYDDFGNLTAIGGQGVSVSSTTNRLDVSGTAYDTRGNLTVKPVATGWNRHSRYDELNRLVATWSEGWDSPSDAYAFAYNQAGERVLRYRVERGVVQEASFYIRDQGENVLSEFLWSPSGEWARMSDTAYLGRKPLVRMHADVNGDRTYTTLVTDHLDSVRAEVFDANPNSPVFNEMDYWPYGELVTHPPALASKQLFTAHEREFIGSATGVNTLEGLDYMHARYYLNSVGRFTVVDPATSKEWASSQSWNRYAYVLNNPLRYWDPTGRYEEDVHRYLTAALAQAAGFDVATSNSIAAADQWTDDNPETVAGESLEARRNFHFTSEERRDEIWASFLSSPSPENLGTFLHAQQDSFSHAGFSPKTGHLLEGHSPDKTFNDVSKANSMAADTYEKLVNAARIMGVSSAGQVPFETFAPLVTRFNAAKTDSAKARLILEIKRLIRKSQVDPASKKQNGNRR